MRIGWMFVLALACAGCVVPRQKFDAVEKQKRLLEDARAKLEHDKEKLAAEKASLEAELAKINMGIAKWEQRISDLKENNDRLSTLIKDITEKSTDLGKKLNECKADKARIDEERGALEKKYRSMERVRKQVQERYVALQKQHLDLKEKLAALEKEKETAVRAAAAEEEKATGEGEVTKSTDAGRPSARAGARGNRIEKGKGRIELRSDADLDISGTEEDKGP